MSRIYEEFDFVFIILLLKLVALEAEDKVKIPPTRQIYTIHAYHEFHQGCAICMGSVCSDIISPLLFLKLRTLSVYVPGDTLVVSYRSV